MQWPRAASFGASALFTGFIAVACGGSSAEEPKVKAAAGDAISLAFPKIAIDPGKEDTKCVVMRLHNEKPLHVGAIHNALSGSSHHLIVYRVNDTEEHLTPFSCAPFTDTLDPTKGSPLMVTQKADDTLTLPPGVGFTLDVNQMVRLEMHYINPSSSPRDVSASTTFTPISDDDFKDEAGFLFIGSPDISLPPRKETKLGPTYFELPDDLDGAKFFAMTGHEHKLGTNVQVAVTSGKSDPGRMVYDVPNWSWSEPKTEVFAQPITMNKGMGFQFTCSWNNVTDERVRFGESANAEMCFFWAYYYPNKGSLVCFHTTYVQKETGGRDICCPGDVYCGLIADFLGDRSDLGR